MAAIPPFGRIGVQFKKAACAVVLASITRVFLSAVWLLWCTVLAGAEYRVDVGDVIEISVARVPELQRRVTVQLDGSILFPLLGTLAVAGLSAPDVQTRVQTTLATKIFQQRTSGGRDNEIVIDPDEVTATIVEYRPIYVNGDVSRPSEHPYRPLMTVRQAVALSGGYDVMRFRMSNPFLESADLRSEYESLWMEFAKEQARMWRIRTELGDEAKPELDTLPDVPLPRPTIAEIVRLESAQLKIRQTDHQRQKSFLEAAVKQESEQVSVLSEQQQKEELGMQADAEELQRAVDLFAKGNLPIPRVTDARRAVLLSSTRKLQTVTQLLQLKRQQSELSRQLERLDDQRQIDLLRELQDAGLRLNEIRAKLQGVGEKLQYTALVRSQLVRGGGNKPEITVIRKSERGREHLVADEEFELFPGDVVDVALQWVDRTATSAQ
jgi:polysaccharide export outer membrane protein